MTSPENRVELTSPKLVWSKSERNSWWKLFDVHLALIAKPGVYVIWHGGYPSRVVRVGHGDIAEGIEASRRDPRVTAYLEDGALFVTWAFSDAASVEGVARYLADTLHPLIADDFSTALPIAANSPF